MVHVFTENPVKIRETKSQFTPDVELVIQRYDSNQETKHTLRWIMPAEILISDVDPSSSYENIIQRDC